MMFFVQVLFALTLEEDWGAVVELGSAVELPVCCCGAQDFSGAVRLLLNHERVLLGSWLYMYSSVFEQ